MKALILGGARSGKSQYAENLAIKSGKQCVYIATGQAHDEEMAERIRMHQVARGDQWIVQEAPIELAAAIQQNNHKNTAILVDCLTLWMSNCMASDCLAEQKKALLAILPTLHCDIYLVSNEVGSGVVPLGKLSRQFVDESGWLHQTLAQLCDRVNLVVAGLPLNLKGGID